MPQCSPAVKPPPPMPSSWLVGQRYSTENFQTFQGTAKVTGYALQMVKPYYWTLTHHRALTSQAGAKLQPSPYSLVFLCPLPQGKASHQSAENPDVIYCENNQLTTLIGCKPTPWNGAHAWHCWSGQEPQKPMDLGENCSTVLLLCWRSTAIKWLNILLHLQTSVLLSHHQRSPVQWVCTNRAPHNGQRAEALKHWVLNGMSLSNSSPRGSDLKGRGSEKILTVRGETPRKHCLPSHSRLTHELRDCGNIYHVCTGPSGWGSQHQDGEVNWILHP